MEALSCPLAFLIPLHTCSKKSTGLVNIQPYLCMVRERCDTVNDPVTVIIGKEYQVDSNGNILNSEDLIVNDSQMRIALKSNLDDGPKAASSGVVEFPRTLGQLSGIVDEYRLRKVNRLSYASDTQHHSMRNSKKRHSKRHKNLVDFSGDEVSVRSPTRIDVSSMTSTSRESPSRAQVYSTQQTNSSSVNLEITKLEVCSSDEVKIHTKRHGSHKSRRTTKNHAKSGKRYSDENLIEVLSGKPSIDNSMIHISESDDSLIHVTNEEENLITVTSVSDKKHSTLKVKRPLEGFSPRSVLTDRLSIDKLSHDSSSQFSSIPSNRLSSILTESPSGTSRRLTSSRRKNGTRHSNNYTSMEVTQQDSVQRTSRTPKHTALDHVSLNGKYQITDRSLIDSTTTRTSNETADTLGDYVKNNMSNLTRPSQDQFIMVNRRNPLSQLACAEGAVYAPQDESSHIEGSNAQEDKKRRKKKSKKRNSKQDSKSNGTTTLDLSTANTSTGDSTNIVRASVPTLDYQTIPASNQSSNIMDSYNSMVSYTYNPMETYVTAQSARTECITRSYVRPYYTDNTQV